MLSCAVKPSGFSEAECEIAPPVKLLFQHKAGKPENNTLSVLSGGATFATDAP